MAPAPTREQDVVELLRRQLRESAHHLVPVARVALSVAGAANERPDGGLEFNFVDEDDDDDDVHDDDDDNGADDDVLDDQTDSEEEFHEALDVLHDVATLLSRTASVLRRNRECRVKLGLDGRK